MVLLFCVTRPMVFCVHFALLLVAHLLLVSLRVSARPSQKPCDLLRLLLASLSTHFLCVM